MGELIKTSSASDGTEWSGSSFSTTAPKQVNSVTLGWVKSGAMSQFDAMPNQLDCS